MNTPSENQTAAYPELNSDHHLPYLVVVADMAFSDHHETIECYHLVITSAEDPDSALAQARKARPTGGGYAPLAAFSIEDLRHYTDLLGSHPLLPGRSFNLMTEMTDMEATAERVAEGEA